MHLREMRGKARSSTNAVKSRDAASRARKAMCVCVCVVKYLSLASWLRLFTISLFIYVIYALKEEIDSFGHRITQRPVKSRATRD